MLVPEFNKYPKPTDWNSLYVLAQQAFENGFRAFTVQDLLNFIDGGGSSIPPNVAPFKVRLGDEQVTIDGADTVILDSRLLGITDYPVNCTQLNNSSFRADELEYNSSIGSVRILNFHLQAGEEVVVIPAVGNSGTGNPMQPILDRISSLERMMSPILSGGRMLWTGPIDEIPVGWVIDEDWNGRVPIGLNPSDTDFNTMGKTGGAKSVTLSTDQQGRIEFQFLGARGSGSNDLNQIHGVRARAQGATEWAMEKYSDQAPAFQWGTSGFVRPGQAGAAHNNLQPYRVGCWIKYVGV